VLRRSPTLAPSATQSTEPRHLRPGAAGAEREGDDEAFAARWVVSGKPARKRRRWRRAASQQAAQQDEGGVVARASEGVRASAERVREGS
jgi:hypothetical protein